MFLYGFVVCAIALAILYIFNYFHNLNQTAEIERQRQKRPKRPKRQKRPKNEAEIKCLGKTSWKLRPHGGRNFASTPTDWENMAESFQNSQLNSTHASETKKRIRENS